MDNSTLIKYCDSTIYTFPTYAGKATRYAEILQHKNIILTTDVEVGNTTNEMKRCEILSANGIQKLTIPTKKIKNKKTKIHEIEVDFAKNWQHTHWHSLFSAYGKTPYFEHYAHNFRTIIEKRHKYLIDYTIEIENTIFDILKPANNIIFGGNTFPGKVKIFRENTFERPTIEYYQIWEEKFQFVPNLSVLDMIFNIGPETIIKLYEMTSTHKRTEKQLLSREKI